MSSENQQKLPDSYYVDKHQDEEEGISHEDAESLVTVEKVYEYIKTHCH